MFTDSIILKKHVMSRKAEMLILCDSFVDDLRKAFSKRIGKTTEKAKKPIEDKLVYGNFVEANLTDDVL